MYLERLAVQGFKSFGERLELTFEPGISAIVGPNGSGKSNIVDAIRWALGEQSLHVLRGERLEDIIFSGSDVRRAHGLAEVTLIFANDDGRLPVPYSEVSVTRRAYRSGSSEFLLNGVPCRLRDIQELFWDTGLGKEGYSFIGQGKVDEVLNLKPEERRVFLEQAAGVWKYRQRKKEAAAKLVQMEQDLLRLRDLSAELNRQLEPLSEEARRAEQYLVKKAREKELKVFLGLTEIERLKADLRRSEEFLAERRLQLSALLAERHRREAELEKDRLALAAQETVLEELSGDVRQAEAETLRLEQRLAELYTLGRERAARSEALEARRREMRAREQELKSQAARDEEERRAVQVNSKEARTRFTALEEQRKGLEAEREQVGRRLEEQREQTITLLSERAAQANALQALEREMHKLKERRARVAAAGKESAERGSELHRVLERERQVLSELEAAARALGMARLSLEESLATERGRLEQRRRETEEHWRRLERLKVELSTQRSLVESHDGYGQGARAVLNARRPGIHGAVADLLDVPQGLELALEAALGGAVEYLVAATDEDAAAAITWLKEKGLGRATFLPLNTVRPAVPRAEERKLVQYPGVLGWAAELVRYAAAHEAAVKYLLGRVLVARTLDAARAVARASVFRVKVVTLEGDVISPGGSMSGGSQRRERRSFLARARRLRELEAAVEEGHSRLARCRAELESVQEKVSSLERDLERTREELARKEESFGECRRRVAQYEAQLTEIERGHLTWQEEEQALAQGLAELFAERTSLETKLSRLEAEAARWQEETRALERRKEDLETAGTTVEEELTRIRLVLAAEEEKERQLALRAEERREAFERLHAELETLAAHARELMAEDAAATAERRRLEDEHAVAQARVASLRDKLAQVQAEVQGLKAGLPDREGTLRSLLRREEKLRQEIHEGEVAFERLAAEHQAAERRLFEAYGVPVGTPVPQLGLTVAEAQAEIARLEEEIATLGEVNLQAPRSLAELTARCEFLDKQAADLEAARETLERMMREIDRTVARRLEDTYTQLRANFQQVFRDLFGGGQADLVLTGTGDLLTGGLEICAQLPGKKMQTLSLLSGGERALAAIAFLFSLLSAHSCSLCVLDEIDAPLDEANAARFLAYLEKLAQTTQFIMITHRKQAMTRAKSLYGLSMAASGVSRLVSVRLEEAV